MGGFCNPGVGTCAAAFVDPCGTDAARCTSNAGANFFAPQADGTLVRHAARAKHEPATDGAHRPRRPRAAPAVRETMNAPIERQDRSRESGFTLVETLVAIVVLVFGLMAVTNLLLVAATSNTVANQSSAATVLGLAGDGPAALDAVGEHDGPGGSLTADTTNPSPDCRALQNPINGLQLRRQHPGRRHGQDALADHGRRGHGPDAADHRALRGHRAPSPARARAPTSRPTGPARSRRPAPAASHLLSDGLREGHATCSPSRVGHGSAASA